MSFILENSAHTQDLQSMVTSWNTQREQHDLLLICNSGLRLSTRQSLISLHSPLIRTLLDTIPPSGFIPAISVSADVMAVSGLICLLYTGNTSAGCKDELEEVIKAAGFLGVGLTNCKMEDNTSRKTPGVVSNNNVFIYPIITAVKKIVKETLSQEESVESNCAPIEIESPKTMRIISVPTSTFKTTKVKGMSNDKCLSTSKKIDSIIKKIKIRTFKCVDCKKQFAQKGNMKTHMIKFHTDVDYPKKPYKCEVCGTQYARKCNLKTHLIKSRGKRKYKCEVCEKVFHQKGIMKLKTHMIEFHPEEKSYKCLVCEKQFTQKGHMKTHMNKSHPDARHVIVEDESSGKGIQKSYVKLIKLVTIGDYT